MVAVQLPAGASKERLDKFLIQVEQQIAAIPGVADYLTISGYSILDGAAISSAGFAVIVMDDWSERGKPSLGQNSIIAQLNQRCAALQDGIATAFPMPSLPGVGVSGGLALQMQDRGGVGMNTLEKIAQGYIADGNTQASLTGMSTTFRANVPQLFVDIDREQVLRKGVALSSVFGALQAYLGSAYINDLTMYNRVFQVKTLSEAVYRAEPRDIGKFEVRNRAGDMVPLASLISVEDSLGPQTVSRFNMYPAIKVMGQPGEGYSSGQAMQVLTTMADEKLPETVSIAWTELSFQEMAASGSTNIIFLIAAILVYLTLAAQYESWSIPVSVLLAIPTAILGAVAALMMRGMSNDIYAQVGVVLLIGLSTKSAILIAEFAKQQHDSGRSIFDSAMDAARLRFRAVLMTALSFILGVIPLVFASGAGAESRKVLGTTVLGGMLIATVLSLVCVPMFYFLIQKAAEGGRVKES